MNCQTILKRILAEFIPHQSAYCIEDLSKELNIEFCKAHQQGYISGIKKAIEIVKEELSMTSPANYTEDNYDAGKVHAFVDILKALEKEIK